MLGKIMRSAAALALGALLLGSEPAAATELGGGAYPNGAEDFMAGAAPPPGTYFINYFDYYSAHGFRGNDGKNLFPFRADVYANTFRLIHITDKKILGGFWGVHMFIPLVKMDVHRSPFGHGSEEGLGDIIVDPFILTWHGKNWHALTGVDIYCPTGEYDRNRPAKIGRNYWTFEPVVAGTYITDSGVELSAKFMYDFNTRNNDTDYRSGQEFHVDYTVAQKLGPFSLGVGGYYYQQTTSDHATGGGELGKGMTIALGPELKYDYKNMGFSVKYDFEVESYNRPQGNNLWAKFIYAF